MKIQDGRAFDRLVREAIEKVKPEKGFKVTFDVAKAADGTAIHEMSGPYDKDDADIVKHFGKGSLAFAFRENDVLIAFGEDSKTAAEGPRGLVEARGLRFGRTRRRGAGGQPGRIRRGNQECFRKAADEVFAGEGRQARSDRPRPDGGRGRDSFAALDRPARRQDGGQ